MFFRGAKKEIDELPEAVQNRIRSTVKYAKIWAGLVIVAAGVMYASKPYLDRLRREDELNNRQNAKPRVKLDDDKSPS